MAKRGRKKYIMLLSLHGPSTQQKFRACERLRAKNKLVHWGFPSPISPLLLELRGGISSLRTLVKNAAAARLVAARRHGLPKATPCRCVATDALEKILLALWV